MGQPRRAHLPEPRPVARRAGQPRREAQGAGVKEITAQRGITEAARAKLVATQAALDETAGRRDELAQKLAEVEAEDPLAQASPLRPVIESVRGRRPRSTSPLPAARRTRRRSPSCRSARQRPHRAPARPTRRRLAPYALDRRRRFVWLLLVLVGAPALALLAGLLVPTWSSRSRPPPPASRRPSPAPRNGHGASSIGRERGSPTSTRRRRSWKSPSASCSRRRRASAAGSRPSTRRRPGPRPPTSRACTSWSRRSRQPRRRGCSPSSSPTGWRATTTGATSACSPSCGATSKRCRSTSAFRRRDQRLRDARRGGERQERPRRPHRALHRRSRPL